jgi:hypothetical protein
MWNVIAFPPARIRDRSSGVRVAFAADQWGVERLKAGEVVARYRMPSQADAQRIAGRISRRDKMPLLPTYQSRSSVRMFGRSTPDDAA